MSTIEGFCDVRTELADVNQEATGLAAKIQTNFEELGE
jgi:hypothetical protein